MHASSTTLIRHDSTSLGSPTMLLESEEITFCENCFLSWSTFRKQRRLQKPYITVVEKETQKQQKTVIQKNIPIQHYKPLAQLCRWYSHSSSGKDFCCSRSKTSVVLMQDISWVQVCVLYRGHAPKARTDHPNMQDPTTTYLNQRTS